MLVRMAYGGEISPCRFTVIVILSMLMYNEATFSTVWKRTFSLVVFFSWTKAYPMMCVWNFVWLTCHSVSLSKTVPISF